VAVGELDLVERQQVEGGGHPVSLRRPLPFHTHGTDGTARRQGRTRGSGSDDSGVSGPGVVEDEGGRDGPVDQGAGEPGELDIVVAGVLPEC